MRGKELRIDKRFRVLMRATLRYGRERFDLLTEDVGFRGVFLRTDTPPDLRQLVKLELELSDTGEKLSLHGMAVHCVPRGNAGGRVPGVGVQFYAVDKTTNSTWSAYVNRMERTHPEALVKPVSVAPPASPEPIRREFPRVAAGLELELRSVDELRTLYSRDVSQGGMFIVTELVLPVGTAIILDVVHPITRAVFVLDAAVRRVSAPGEVQSLGIEFTNIDDGRRTAFWDFVRDTFSFAPPELIEADDPFLA